MPSNQKVDQKLHRNLGTIIYLHNFGLRSSVFTRPKLTNRWQVVYCCHWSFDVISCTIFRWHVSIVSFSKIKCRDSGSSDRTWFIRHKSCSLNLQPFVLLDLRLMALDGFSLKWRPKYDAFFWSGSGKNTSFNFWFESVEVLPCFYRSFRIP